MISAEQRLKRKGRILLAQFFERDMLEGEGHAGAHYRGGLVLADRRLFADGVPRTGRRDGGEVYPEMRGRRSRDRGRLPAGRRVPVVQGLQPKMRAVRSKK